MAKAPPSAIKTLNFALAAFAVAADDGHCLQVDDDGIGRGRQLANLHLFRRNHHRLRKVGSLGLQPLFRLIRRFTGNAAPAQWHSQPCMGQSDC
jgi:hypothetical protein